ncbi:hypothetical protein ARTSIC4J27_3584 [Pseudarthrobacter siccitolerans]|uniref:Uncharacterized protein n=1 Tax=Pseudarthrobacter siccitolerans TaxID=861266 RepID=A0A024H6T0_9MICC|nr:hypothetical protein ARTSIC4J27_3584 [Pseudarthrobacter siccitolerans]
MDEVLKRYEGTNNLKEETMSNAAVDSTKIRPERTAGTAQPRKVQR